MGLQTQQVSVNMYPLGIRLNNPGNIIHSDNRWNGETRLQKDKKFVRFITPQAGIRAMMKILLTYQNEYHFATIGQIITRYAPPEENNTQSYIDDVVIRIGIPDNKFIDLSNVETLMILSESMVIHEQGRPPNSLPMFWYEEKVYHDAAIDALNSEEE
jgi:hypothetical protein